jgi:hypothetical protein
MGSKHKSIIQDMVLVVLLLLQDLRHLDTNPRAALAVQGLVVNLVVMMANGWVMIGIPNGIIPT